MSPHLYSYAQVTVAAFWQQISLVQLSFASNTLPAAVKAVS